MRSPMSSDDFGKEFFFFIPLALRNFVRISIVLGSKPNGRYACVVQLVRLKIKISPRSPTEKSKIEENRRAESGGSDVQKILKMRARLKKLPNISAESVCRNEKTFFLRQLIEHRIRTCAPMIMEHYLCRVYNNTKKS